MAGYGDDSGFTDWLADNGHTLPDGALSSAVLRQRGSVYVDGLYGARFTGVPTDGVMQERAWPRTGATAYGSDIASDAIPSAVVQASYAAALYEAENPGGLSVAVTAAGAVKREKVGPLETEYFEGTGDVAADATPALSIVQGLLTPFLRQPEPAIFIV
ncbi:DnaT-like ssDNA-binding protein [Brevundimonas sp. LjRoot202]|uniref:DnaT-like ssDNA-binding protein n=1 Tax=Brevundimonas sp. LjRoot202 TaxID=3342281 RepID=UPI003ECCD65E